MKPLRIVIVAQHFRPQSDAGAVRPWRQAELLGRAGHDVTVITAAREPMSGPYTAIVIQHRTPGQWVRLLTRGSSSSAVSEDVGGRLGVDPTSVDRVVGAAKQALVWLEGAIIWGIRCGMRVRSLARSGQIDLLLTSSPPYAVNLAGIVARRRVGRWVIDYRDLFSCCPYYGGRGIKRAFEQWFERLCLGTCDAVMVTSPGVEPALRRMKPGLRIAAAPTGVWTAAAQKAVAPITAEPSDGPLTVLYTGILYNRQRDPGPMIEALKLMRAASPQGNRFKVVFMGADCEAARYVAEQHGVSDAVELTGSVPSEQARRAQQEADALLMIGMELFESTSQAVPQKLWEYMETGRLIIATGFPTDGYVAKLLRDYRLSIVSDDPHAIAEGLLAYAEGGFDPSAGDAEEGLAAVPTSAAMVATLESLAWSS